MIKILNSVSKSNPYRFKFNQPVAVYWGEDEKGKPEFYAGVVKNLDSEYITVELNSKEVEKIPREDHESVVVLTELLPDKRAYSKSEVAKARLVEPISDDVDPEMVPGSKLYQWASEDKGSFGVQIALTPVTEGIFEKFVRSKIKVSGYDEFKDVWGEQFVLLIRYNGKNGSWLFKDLKRKSQVKSITPSGKWVKRVKSFSDKAALDWGTTLITDDQDLPSYNSPMMPK